MACVNLEKSWMTAILFLHSQEKVLSMKVDIMCANIKIFDLLASCHYIMNLSHTPIYKPNHEKNSAVLFFPVN